MARARYAPQVVEAALKAHGSGADTVDVELTRVVVESEGRAFRLDLHPRFTVVSGLDPAARRSLALALVTAMGPGRPGLHLEASTDAGRHLAVFRPPRNPHQVVDVDEARDVTQAFAGSDGRPDLLAACGVARGDVTERLLVGPEDLERTSSVEQRLSALARIDQSRLWEVASKVKDREAQLARLDGDHDEFDPEVISRVDKYHRAFETAQAKNERGQRVWLLFGANTMLIAVVIAMLHTWLAAIPVAVAAGIMLAWSGRLWRRVDAARRAESDALDEVGADSYLTFQLTRLDRALDSESHRKRVAHADSALRGAVAEWELLAGDVTVAWYLDHREEVEESALRLFSRNDRRSPMSLALPHPQDDEVEQLARLKDRLAEPAGDGGPVESLPVICDDPLVELGPERKPQLLEALVDASTRRQVILLTGDPDVAAWARVEALTGEVGLVEAAPVR